MPPKKAFKKGCRKNDKSNYERRPAWQEHTPANQNFEAYYKVLYTLYTIHSLIFHVYRLKTYSVQRNGMNS